MKKAVITYIQQPGKKADFWAKAVDELCEQHRFLLHSRIAYLLLDECGMKEEIFETFRSELHASTQPASKIKFYRKDFLEKLGCLVKNSLDEFDAVICITDISCLPRTAILNAMPELEFKDVAECLKIAVIETDAKSSP